MRRVLAPVLLLPALAACAPRLALPEADRQRVVQDLRGARRFLRVAANAGPLYGDPGKVMVSDRPHSELDLLQTPSGEPIAPPPPERILAPGTPVVVEDVEFPTGLRFASRPLMTPRYHPWVVFRVPDDSRPQVLVLSQSAATAADAMAEVDRVLSVGDPSPQLAALSPIQREAVLRKDVVDGMTRQAVTLAWGFPDRIVMDRPAGTEDWTWEGGKRRAFFQADRLQRWSR